MLIHSCELACCEDDRGAQQAGLFQQARDGRLVVDNRGRLTLDGRQVEAPPPLEPVVYRDPRKVNPFAR